MSRFSRLIVLFCLTVGLASAALAQDRLPAWAAPSEGRPAPSGFSPLSDALDSNGIDPFPDDPVQAPMQGLVLLALAGAAYGVRRLKAQG